MGKILRNIGRLALLVAGAKAGAQILKKQHPQRPDPKGRGKIDVSGARYIPNQLVIWRRPGVPDAQFEAWKKENIPLGVTQTKLCRGCDDSLELWEGDNVSTLINGKVASSGIPPGGGGPTGGGDAVACYSYNLLIDLPEPGICVQGGKPNIRLPQQPSGDPLIVAVFDTGLDPQVRDAFTQAVPSCQPGGEKGWNFFDKTPNTIDDHPALHGTTVSKFIIDQAAKWGKQRISILPVKVHNKQGKSDLFSILCGFAYAANCGARIINASFGFYAGNRTGPPAILAEFVRKHLTANNILLVAAAGNVNADKSATEPEDAVRNLEENPFYPAALARQFDNVLAVTTASPAKDAVSPSQNFSKIIVDTGVQGDAEVQEDYRFRDPLDRHEGSGETIFIIGSSFATPIFTGILAQHYDAVTGSIVDGSINKAKLLQNLRTSLPQAVSAGNAPLDQFVKEGVCCVK